MALRSQIINLIRTEIVEQFCHLGGVGQITIVEKEPRAIDVRIRVEMIDPAGIERRSAANDAMNFISFPQEEFCEVGAILSGNAGDECFFHQTIIKQSLLLVIAYMRNYLFT